jgi:hypothetical protein
MRYKCTQHHTEMTKGDGVTPKDKCYYSHVDRTEKYNDFQFIHEKHVVQKQIDCLWYHSRIEHGKISMAEKILMLK